VEDGHRGQQDREEGNRDDQGARAEHGLQGDRLGDAGARRRWRGVSDRFGLAFAYAHARTLRFADGPDEVHRNAIAKQEIAEQTSIEESLAKAKRA